MESPLRRLGKIEPQCEQTFSIPNHERRWLHLQSRSNCSGYCIFVLPVPGYFFNKFRKKSNVIEHVKETFTTEETLEGAKTYLDICRTPMALPCLAVGEKREFCDLLRGLRFTIVDRFKRGLTQDFLKDRISEMGGVVYEKGNAENIMESHSNILNFYVIVKDEEDLINATGDKYQLEAMRTKLKLLRHCTASELSTDAESREDEKCSTKMKLSPAALACKRLNNW